MAIIPKVNKGLGSGLTRSEKIRKTILGVALAVGAGATALAAFPATAAANVPSVGPPSVDRGALVLSQPSAQSAQGQVAQATDHYSHASHESHASHSSHYSSSY